MRRGARLLLSALMVMTCAGSLTSLIVADYLVQSVAVYLI
jgi:hypothetical protein